MGRVFNIRQRIKEYYVYQSVIMDMKEKVVKGSQGSQGIP